MILILIANPIQPTWRSMYRAFGGVPIQSFGAFSSEAPVSIARRSHQGSTKTAFGLTSLRHFSTDVSPPSFHDPSTERKMSALELQYKRRKNEKVAMITAYDYPSAKHAEEAGFDIVLVGDSLGMVVLGYDSTQPVTMEDMLHHCKAVRRGAPSRFIVADLPFGSYESGPQEALQSAMRLVKEGGADAVKLEGGRNRCESVRKIVDSGIAVCGHIGLTPQAISVLGGFRAQGRTAIKARRIVDDAIALQNAGAFGLVIECVPAPVAKSVTDALEIPVIGIGAGPHVSGQVLVYHDVLGVSHHPHFDRHIPSFCKRYARLGGVVFDALSQFKEEVKTGAFPDENEFSPYKMSEKEEKAFHELMSADQAEREKDAKAVLEEQKISDEYDQVKLY